MGRRRRQSPSPPVPYGPVSLRAVADWLDRGSPPSLAGSQIAVSRVDRAHSVGNQLAIRLRNAAKRGGGRHDANLIAFLVTGIVGSALGSPAEQVEAVNDISGHLWYAATNVFTKDEQASHLAFTLSACVRMEAARMMSDESQEATYFLEMYRFKVQHSIALVESPRRLGSAFCIRKLDGYSVWLTAEHVIQGMEKVRLYTFGDQRGASAEIIKKWSGEHDVAVLGVALDAPPLPLGAEPFTGTDVYALGYGGQMAGGNASIIRGRAIRSYTYVGSELSYIDTDAAVHPGDSGGPLLDIWGAVVGMIRGSDRGFAVALSVDSIPQEARRAQRPGSSAMFSTM